ncbi:phage holin family protein [Novosphingobium sp. Gsoil 351]|uniref:phage holin family protein n=1 Tax=Novosphingobium sp. Gsoil 351 TaxID=2675225 RepID=UPI0012B4F3AB|nr:phage holin family protein [Novosphingobium sp. Gsoil 351]QGN53875.1 phage holin family protein [Novosphingobium sp. Gsoil 351]
MGDPADDEPDRIPPEAGEDLDAGPLVDRIKDLAVDTRTAIEAELAWQSARAGYVGGQIGGIAGWGGLAVLCAFIALLALAFGAILALAPLIGAAWATLAVVAMLLLVAAISGLVARSRVRRLKATAFKAAPDPAP